MAKFPVWYNEAHVHNNLVNKLKNSFTVDEIYNISSLEDSWPGVYFKLKHGNKFAYFHYIQFPGCCGMVLFFGLNYSMSFDMIEKAMRIIATDGNYDSMIYSTTPSYQKPLENDLRKAEWSIIHTFINPNTNNQVNLWIKSVSN